jgi:site-specific recombinase XerD
MKTLLDSKNNPAQLSGALGSYVSTYLARLASQGYKRPTLYPDALLFTDLDRWMKRAGLQVQDLSERVLERFLTCHMRTRSTRRQPKRAALRRLLTMLRQSGVTSDSFPSAVTPTQHWVLEFARYLREDCGYAATTIGTYCLAAKRLLVRLYGSGPVRLETLSAADVFMFVSEHTRKYGRSSSQSATIGLRSFFRFLRCRGEITLDLAATVPSVAGWALAGLPRHLPAGSVDRVLASQKPTSPAGMRDFAILTLLARLGLRSCEVAALRLDDIDWGTARLSVRSRKAGRSIALPLPAEVGRAIAAYLKSGRPRCECRELFVRSQAPRVALSRMAVGHVARTALQRTGITGVSMGAHTFRHTLATDLLRRGASLDQIGRILRHKNASTTAIYAKVDMEALRPLAMRWPGGGA